MSRPQIAYEQLLSVIPNTAVVIFDKDLNIHQMYDSEEWLKNLFPDQETVEEWGRATNFDLKGELRELLKADSGYRVFSRNIDHSSGRITLKASIHEDESRIPYGVLFFQQAGGKSDASELKLIREKEEAEESNEIKGRFLARVSHEIRTPLNAIIGFVEQLQKTDLNPQQQNFAGIVEKSSVYLLDLVNEILAFSRLESGEMKLDEVDFSLESLTQEIFNTLKVRAEEKSINLRYTLDENLKIICYGDAFRLKQILINLVSNGIKFTEYGYVELGVKLMEETNDLVWTRFTIADSGIGIPEKKLNEIFEEYKQASAGIARKHGGSGLGLTISKRLTEVMKGTLSVTSDEGMGSVFTVDLPLRRSKKKYLSKDILQVDTDELFGRRALLVDDDAMNRALGQIILEGFNMDVSLVSDGKEAMEVYQAGKFELVLLDIHMPEISGFEVADFIRKQKMDQKVKIIAVTADILQEDEALIERNQIDGILIKPYKEISLYNKICQVLEVDTKIILKESIELKSLDQTKNAEFDLSELRAVTRGNHAFFNEMIDTFIENAQEGIQQLREALNREDWEEIRETSHRLIPSYKHLKIKELVSDLIEVKDQSTVPVDKELVKGLVENIEEMTRVIIEGLKTQKHPD